MSDRTSFHASMLERGVKREARRALILVCIVLMVAACGRRPGEPTPLPLGTRVAQPTPDFSAPSQGNSAATETADRVAETVRTRLAQQQEQTDTVPTTADARPDPPQSAQDARSGLSVFSLPTALGIVVGGGPLYSTPGAGAILIMQVGSTLTITGRSADGGWYAAYLADGTAGWAPVSQVRIFGDAAGLEIVQESLGPAVVATLIAEASKPVEPIGTVVVRLTQTRTADSPSAAATPQPDTAPAITGPSVTVVVEGANVRSGPGTGFAVVGGLYENEQAALLGRNLGGDWVQVQLPESVGWIFAPLVETSVPIAELPVVDVARLAEEP
jgi:hypothetical protein